MDEQGTHESGSEQVCAANRKSGRCASVGQTRLDKRNVGRDGQVLECMQSDGTHLEIIPSLLLPFGFGYHSRLVP